MQLASGSRLGAYEILTLLGSGGMGEVYRARDTKLGREVALKILPDTFTHDPERLARFRREAQVLASLNHPHIGAIYGLDEANGQQFLVLELVDGESLDKRIARGPIPIDEALAIAKQIAEALETAHEKGIIHRDLKPANIALTSDGSVKVLDFGLAKATEASNGASLANSPTITSPAMMTGVGMILGTAAYMSPEQAKGRPADKRADVWAYGCVLYEMLTGRRAFAGDDVPETLAAVLRGEADWSAAEATAPPPIVVLLRGCLRKDRLQRIGDLAAVRFVLSEHAALTRADQNLPGSIRFRWPVWAVVALMAVGLVAAGTLIQRPTRVIPSPTRFQVTVPVGTALVAEGAPSSIAISSDGSRLVFVAGSGGETLLYSRGMDQIDAVPIQGSSGGQSGPFFSPDGQWVGFFSNGTLKKISVNGGNAQTLVTTNRTPLGGSWGEGNTIVFAVGGSGLQRISALGGQAEQLTTIDTAKGESNHRWPEILPGGKAVVFTSQVGTTQQIVLRRLDTGEQRVLDDNGSTPHYVASGHLVFLRAGTLFAAPFDLGRLQLLSPPVPVLEEVARNGAFGSAPLTVSKSGTLAYVRGGELGSMRTVVWVNRQGAIDSVIDTPKAFREVRLSPDGSRIAIGLDSPRDLWTYDLGRRMLSRFTFEETESESPVWAPDGQRIAFGAARPSQGRLVLWKSSDGTGGEHTLLTGGPVNHYHPAAWSPDGKTLIFTDTSPNGNGDGIWILDLGSDKPQPFAEHRFNERAPTFSPDGRWIAYVSNETGRDEIFVQSYRGPPGKWEVSVDGGAEPMWAPNGRELFYRVADKMMAVNVTTQPAFSADRPRVLFDGKFARPRGQNLNYDVSPDGQRFLMIKDAQNVARPSSIVVVLNWLEELKARVPVK